MNKEDQSELKKKFGSATVSRKRKNEKTASSINESGDVPKAKQSEIDETYQSSSEQDETLQKKVFRFDCSHSNIHIEFLP